MRLQAYFDRIGFRGTARTDLATLAALQRHHVTAIPFENLDVQLGRPLTTAVADAYDKIVGRGRGGWCYEQNGLFGWALEAAGFEVTRLAAAVMRHERGEIATANHLALRVSVPGSATGFLADVGFGGSLLAPIPLEAGEHRQPPFTLGLERLADGHWQFWEDAGDGRFSFDFLDEPADETALSERCEFLQTDPASGFVKSLVAQRRLTSSHVTLRGRVLTTISADGTATETLASADQLVEVLADEFGLRDPGVKTLWPRIVRRHDELFSSAAT